MDKLKRALSGQEDEEQGGIMTDVRDASSLSWGTRIKAFAICFVVGVLVSILGSVFVFFARYATFGVLFTIGNILSIASTCFLMGPLKQVKRMFATTRLIATIVVLISFVMTLLCGLLWRNGGLTLLFCLVQYVAMTWYALSYIPYARDAVKNCFGAIAS